MKGVCNITAVVNKSLKQQVDEIDDDDYDDDMTSWQVVVVVAALGYRKINYQSWLVHRKNRLKKNLLT